MHFVKNRLEVTVVNKSIQVSGLRLHNAASVYCIVCSKIGVHSFTLAAHAVSVQAGHVPSAPPPRVASGRPTGSTRSRGMLFHVSYSSISLHTTPAARDPSPKASLIVAILFSRSRSPSHIRHLSFAPVGPQIFHPVQFNFARLPQWNCLLSPIACFYC